MRDALKMPWVGQNIRRARLEKGYTQQQLAQASGYQQAQISYIENSTSGNIRIGILYAIANALGVSIESLFNE